jgi:hypothetical protein
MQLPLENADTTKNHLKQAPEGINHSAATGSDWACSQAGNDGGCITRTTNPDGSWDNVVQTMNVDQVDPKTGRHFKTMTIDRTSGK